MPPTTAAKKLLHRARSETENGGGSALVRESALARYTDSPSADNNDSYNEAAPSYHRGDEHALVLDRSFHTGQRGGRGEQASFVRHDERSFPTSSKRPASRLTPFGVDDPPPPPRPSMREAIGASLVASATETTNKYKVLGTSHFSPLSNPALLFSNPHFVLPAGANIIQIHKIPETRATELPESVARAAPAACSNMADTSSNGAGANIMHNPLEMSRQPPTLQSNRHGDNNSRFVYRRRTQQQQQQQHLGQVFHVGHKPTSSIEFPRASDHLSDSTHSGEHLLLNGALAHVQSATAGRAKDGTSGSTTHLQQSKTDDNQPNKQRKKRKYTHEPFPARLHRLIRESMAQGQSSIVRFTDCGNQFMILNTQSFEHEILPKYFRHNRIDSFKRLLRMYQFRRIAGTWTQGTFEHDLFQRDAPELAKYMERVEQPKKKKK